MALCQKCGQPVDFRWIDGVCTPLHFEGGCTSDKASKNERALRSPDSKCIPSKCPSCFQDVFFIRHNGGSVWIDPPLGTPWLKHPCMDATPQIATVSSSPRASIIESHLLQSLGKKTSTLVGVVTALEVRRDHKQTIVSADVGEAEDLVLLVRNSAGAFLGRLVLIDGKAKRIFHNSAQRFGFPILNCLSIPIALKDRGIALPKLLSSGGRKAVRNTFRPKEEVERECLVNRFRKGDRDKLSTGKLIELIPNLSGREKADAENLAALRILHHASRSGDCTLAGPLVQAVHHQKRQRLIDWFARCSPISVKQSRSGRGFRSYLRKSEDGDVEPFQLEKAQRYPFNR